MLRMGINIEVKTLLKKIGRRLGLPQPHGLMSKLQPTLSQRRMVGTQIHLRRHYVTNSTLVC